jgi:predicted DCC family thiol-disulfide oxidoreductase YuxK
MNLPNSDHPVVLFDGVCNLCNGVVRFIIARDPAARFRFAPLPPADTGATDSIVLVEAGQRYTRSTAALRIARGLRFPWPVLYALMLAPRPLRDLVYDWVARHRYCWFGKRAACMVPTPEVRSRFLE